MGRFLPDARRLLFAIQKVDAKELERLYNIIATDDKVVKTLREESLHKKFRLSLNSLAIISQLKKICPSTDDRMINTEKRASEVLNKRIERALQWITHKKMSEIPSEIIDFLEACTENFAWSGFLVSLGRALGDRVNKTIPRFSFMTTGYSASSMFMASIQNELRQVVKLSSAKKLEQERWNYSKYVRYRLVNSARIPTSGFAFDSRGVSGRGQPDQGFPYGALVSDLVSGEKESSARILTLLTILADVYLEVDKKQKGYPLQNEILSAIETLFRSGLNLWKIDVDALDDVSVVVLIHDSFRLSHHSNLHNKELDDELEKRKRKFNVALGAFNHITKSCNKDAIDIARFYRRIAFAGTVKKNSEQLKKISSIIHGDLNGRNLTWSGGLKSFFMIDFEHTRPFFVGADQFRLAVNLVVELITEPIVVQRSPDEINPELFLAVDNGIFVVSNFCAILLKNKCKKIGGVEYVSLTKALDLVFENIRMINSNLPFDQCFLCQVLRILLFPYSDIDIEGEIDTDKQWWNSFWGYALFTAIIKEFEYSCYFLVNNKNVSKNVFDDKDASIDLLRMSSKEIFVYLHKTLSEVSRKDMIGNYCKHIIAAKIIYAVFELVMECVD